MGLGQLKYAMFQGLTTLLFAMYGVTQLLLLHTVLTAPKAHLKLQYVGLWFCKNHSYLLNVLKDLSRY